MTEPRLRAVIYGQECHLRPPQLNRWWCFCKEIEEMSIGVSYDGEARDDR